MKVSFVVETDVDRRVVVADGLDGGDIVDLYIWAKHGQAERDGAARFIGQVREALNEVET